MTHKEAKEKWSAAKLRFAQHLITCKACAFAWETEHCTDDDCAKGSELADVMDHFALEMECAK